MVITASYYCLSREILQYAGGGRHLCGEATGGKLATTACAPHTRPFPPYPGRAPAPTLLAPHTRLL